MGVHRSHVSMFLLQKFASRSFRMISKHNGTRIFLCLQNIHPHQNCMFMNAVFLYLYYTQVAHLGNVDMYISFHYKYMHCS